MLKSVLKRAAPQSVLEYMNDIKVRLSRLEATEERIARYQATITMLENVIDEMVDTDVYQADPAVGFNSQTGRKKIFTDLLAAFDFRTIIETGTWTGNTTGFMAETARVPVYSAELTNRFHNVARKRLGHLPNVTMRNEDSRKFLGRLTRDDNITSGWTLFYLDAHWYSDLPLAEEIDLIAGAWKNFVIMVDDFEVPGDAGYGFDDYGSGKALNAAYIAPSQKKHGLTAWYPALLSEEETGAKRGCVVIAPSGEASKRLANVPSLVQKMA